MDEKQLLAELKGILQITWNDKDEDLRKMINRSMAYLCDLTGTSFDFSVDAPPKELMLERCRYVYNNAADEFEKNFHHELSRLILNVAMGKSW
jgi:hypothetical protein